MIVEIFHHDIEQGPDVFVHVANFEAESGVSDEMACEAAYCASQNIFGSWSRGQLIEDSENEDYSPQIEVLAPLPVYNGKEYGLRSSMVGDRFVIEGRVFRCAGFGFELM